MIILFKLVGAFIGLKIAKALGLSPLGGVIIGAILGHSLDIVVSTKINQAKAKRYWKARASEEYGRIFMGTVFTMLGKLCSVDGKIAPQELAAVEDLITNKLKMRRKEKNEALKLFQAARHLGTSFQYDAAQFFEIHQSDPASLENFVAILFTVATADGPVNESEERLIRTAATVFNLSDERYQTMAQHFTGKRAKRANGADAGAPSSALDSSDPYTVLGVKRSDPVATIKQSYRKLVSDYHPDKIVSKNLPEDFTRYASERFKSIQAAYEAVKAERGFS